MILLKIVSFPSVISAWWGGDSHQEAQVVRPSRSTAQVDNRSRATGDHGLVGAAALAFGCSDRRVSPPVWTRRIPTKAPRGERAFGISHSARTSRRTVISARQRSNHRPPVAYFEPRYNLTDSAAGLSGLVESVPEPRRGRGCLLRLDDRCRLIGRPPVTGSASSQADASFWEILWSNRQDHARLRCITRAPLAELRSIAWCGDLHRQAFDLFNQGQPQLARF
jgi:hypothetical protein